MQLFSQGKAEALSDSLSMGRKIHTPKELSFASEECLLFCWLYFGKLNQTSQLTVLQLFWFQKLFHHLEIDKSAWWPIVHNVPKFFTRSTQLHLLYQCRDEEGSRLEKRSNCNILSRQTNILAGWFCPRTYHGVSVNMFIWAVVFWMLDWGWSFCLPAGSHTSLLKLGLVVGRRSQHWPLHRTAVSSQATAPGPTGGSWLSLTRSRPTDPGRTGR